MQFNPRSLLFILAAAGFLIFLASRKSNSRQTPSNSITSVNDERAIAEKTAEKIIPKDPALLYGDAEERIADYSLDKYPETTGGILLAGEDLEELRGYVKRALQDSVNMKLAKKWKADLIKKQIKYYPILRRHWVALAKHDMWENDIEVRASGTGSTVLTFTGGAFANNKNKSDTQEALSEAFNTLRFKQTRYKWYSGDEEYTYYTLHTPVDSEF